jgi:Ion channel
LLLLFAGTSVVMAAISVGNFGEPLTRTGALYFTVTVFSTVGFGDITGKTEAARLVVTGQKAESGSLQAADLPITRASDRTCRVSVARWPDRPRYRKRLVRRVFA